MQQPAYTQYHEDPKRISDIEAIMTQAFGIRGQTLSDEKADEVLPGWLAAFRTIPTEHLEQVRLDGLERRCTTADQFVAVFEAWMRKIAADREFRRQQEQFRQEREHAVQPGQHSPAKERFAARWAA